MCTSARLRPLVSRDIGMLLRDILKVKLYLCTQLFLAACQQALSGRSTQKSLKHVSVQREGVAVLQANGVSLTHPPVEGSYL